MLADPLGWLAARDQGDVPGPAVVDRAVGREAAGRRRRARDRRAGDHGRPRSGAHPGSVAFRLPCGRRRRCRRSCSRATCCSPAASAAPTCPAATPATMLAAWPARSCTLRDEVWCCPATARRPRSAASGRPTRSCRTCRTSRAAAGPGAVAPMAPHRTALRLPGVAARPAHRRAARARHPARGLRAARLRVDRDALGRAAGADAAQGRDRQGGLRPAPAAGRRRRTPTPTRSGPGSWGCTST